MNYIIIIVLLSIAGPLIGSLLGIIKKPSKIFLYNLMSFAAGVMLAVAFIQLIPESIKLSSVLACCIGVACGALLMYAFDRLIPHIHPELYEREQGSTFKKTAFLLFLGIFLHNFPEGMAIAAGSVTNIKLSLAVAIAIALHDIPEGLCTCSPYYYVSKKRLKSFLISSSTAIPTLLGFFIAYFVFQNINLSLIGKILGATAGIMIYISADELIPASCRKEDKHWNHSTIFSLIAGVISVIVIGLI
ncbi:ZIP family metal transporter [Candidatus Woesearchaeota archaeon]|nr:ZIP family metal transporter [Candidatus Woesearchaeota archaeon]